MKKVLSFLAILICLQSMKQKPWKPVGQVTQITPGQVIKQQEMVKEAVKSQAEKQAAIDKVLNSKITHMSFIVSNYSCDSWKVFEHRVAVFYHPAIPMGYAGFSIKETNPIVYGDREYTIPHATSPNWEIDPLKTITYKTLLETGFEMFINFYGRKTEYRVPAPGTDWSADFFVVIYFDNTTSVKIPLQDYHVGSNKGAWVRKNDLRIDRKKIPGSALPDPANPLVLAPVK